MYIISHRRKIEARPGVYVAHCRGNRGGGAMRRELSRKWAMCTSSMNGVTLYLSITPLNMSNRAIRMNLLRADVSW